MGLECGRKCQVAKLESTGRHVKGRGNEALCENIGRAAGRGYTADVYVITHFQAHVVDTSISQSITKPH